MSADRRVLAGHAAAVAALFGAATSALLVATVDLATYRWRLVDEIATARPLWLYTFSIAVMTGVLAATRLDLARPFLLPGRLACGLVAVLNLTVPILERDRSVLGVVLSVAHVGLAALLVRLAVARRRR